MSLRERCARCLRAGAAREIHMWGCVYYCRRCALEKGGLIGRRAVALHDIQHSKDGFSPASLQRLADGGIMDATALFLPAGKVTIAEADARERAGVERLE